MLELEVKQILSPVINSNFDLVKVELTESIKKYKNLIVTSEGLKGAKADQVTLSKMEKKIDDYRKLVKKEVEKPIKEFEGKCKELIGLVSEARVPLKASIEVFDEAEREKKRLVATEYINKTIVDLLLNDKHSVQLIIQDDYTNVAMTAKKIKEDIEKRGLLLQQAQQQEAENLQIIKDTIENVNRGIDAKILLEDFQEQIDRDIEVRTILFNINIRAERIKGNELKAVADKAAKAEREVQERIAKAEREAVIKAQNLDRIERELKEEKEETERLRLKAIEDVEIAERNKATEKLEQEAKLREMARNINVEAKETPIEKMYFFESRIEGTLQQIKDLSQFLKDNNYKYEATNKGLI